MIDRKSFMAGYLAGVELRRHRLKQPAPHPVYNNIIDHMDVYPTSKSILVRHAVLVDDMDVYPTASAIILQNLVPVDEMDVYRVTSQIRITGVIGIDEMDVYRVIVNGGD